MERRSRKTFVMFSVLLAVPALLFADLGPKPSVEVKIENRGSEECWATLISETPSTGPASEWDGVEEHAYYAEGQEDIWRAMVQYEDEDGYHFLQWVWDVSEDGTFRWGYYPPERFKVLLYYPGTDEFRVSGILERYAFDSYFSVDATKMEAVRNYDWPGEMISLILRIVITISIELLIAWLFKYRETSQMKFIAWVNTVSQVMLNVALSLINYSFGAWTFFWWYLMLEVLVFALEACLYVFWLPHWSRRRDISRGRAVLYALVANLASFLSGFLIFQLIPGIF